MSFNILYQEGGDVQSHLSSLSVYLDSCAKGMGIERLRVDPSKLTAVATALLRPDFPHVDGLEKASPFKKAANVFVWFVAERPVIDSLPVEIAGTKLTSLANHQNVVMAWKMCTRCLRDAKLYKTDEKGNEDVVVLSEPIRVSKHFFCDFVDAFSAAAPAQHFHIMSLIFEQLAYKSNNTASYPETV
ncbi:MAG: hypothetical protein ACOYM3_30310 [Terrimicrobiaceae bacterium]